MTVLHTFSRELADLLSKVGQAQFPARLINLLKALVPAHDATVILYPGGDLPRIEHSESGPVPSESSLGLFVNGAFLLDPFYLAASGEGRSGFFRLQELAPHGFRDSEYYKTWYSQCGFQDECGYLAPLSDSGFVNIALGKTRPRARFTRPELKILEDITPVILHLCRQHWQRQESAATHSDLRARLQAALDAFGRSLLTDREAQVINLILHGHSTRTIAEKLSISAETVKLHRKHAYAKLEVGSQSELFYLFIDSVVSARNYEGGDTLISYLQPPPKTQRRSGSKTG